MSGRGQDPSTPVQGAREWLLVNSAGKVCSIDGPFLAPNETVRVREVTRSTGEEARECWVLYRKGDPVEVRSIKSEALYTDPDYQWIRMVEPPEGAASIAIATSKAANRVVDGLLAAQYAKGKGKSEAIESALQTRVLALEGAAQDAATRFYASAYSDTAGYLQAMERLKSVLGAGPGSPKGAAGA